MSLFAYARMSLTLIAVQDEIVGRTKRVDQHAYPLACKCAKGVMLDPWFDSNRSGTWKRCPSLHATRPHNEYILLHSSAYRDNDCSVAEKRASEEEQSCLHAARF